MADEILRDDRHARVGMVVRLTNYPGGRLALFTLVRYGWCSNVEAHGTGCTAAVPFVVINDFGPLVIES
jgi:hypothetical protein